MITYVLFNVALAESAAYYKKIKVSGNRRIESETIKSYIPEKALHDNDALNATIKNLFALGHFKDIKTKRDSAGNLIVEVIEQPIVNKVGFEGNKKVKDELINEHIHIKPNETFSEAKALEGEAIISEIYRASGFYATKVTPKIVPLPENRVDVVFEINEGQKAYINTIKFVGNKNISSTALEKTIQSKIYRSYRFFSNDHFFSRERLASDSEEIINYYKDHGFPDARIESFISDLAKDKSGFNLTFFVDEGKKYVFGKISIESAIKDVNINQLKNYLGPKSNEPYSLKLINDTLEAMLTQVTKQGFNFSKIDFEETRKNGTIDIVFKITRGPRLKIRRIHIKGNKFNRETTIREQLVIHEEDAYNQYKVERSEARLRRTGFFKKVDIQKKKVDDGVVDLVITVEEQPTGSFAFQVGYGSYDGFLAQIKFSKPNIAGTRKEIDATISIAGKEQDISFNIDDPRFLDRNVSAGFGLDLSRSTHYSDRTIRSIGGNIHASYNLNEYLRQSWSYGLGVSKIDEADNKGKSFWKNPAGAFKDGKDDKDSKQLDLDNVPWDRLGNPDLERPFVEIKTKGDEQWSEEVIYSGVDGKLGEKRKFEHKENTIWSPDFDRDHAAEIAENFNNGSQTEKDAELIAALKKQVGKKAEDLLDADDILKIWRHKSRLDRRREIFKDDTGLKVYSKIAHSLTFYPKFPGLYNKSNLSLNMRNVFAGLGGNVKYLENDFTLRYRYLLTETIRFDSRFTFGFISKIGDNPLRISDCKTLGGMDFHGFDFGGISPRDKETGIAVGGTRFYYGSVGLSCPFIKEEYNIRTGVYTDFGSVWKSKFYTNTEDYKNRFYDENYLRVASGVFVELTLPGFPIRVDYAIPWRKKGYDRTQRFTLGLAGMF